MKVIILGCGYLGYNLSKELSENNNEVLCIGAHSPYSVLMYQQYQELDVYDFKQLESIDFKDAVVIDALSNIDNHAESQDEETLILELENKYNILLNKLYELGVKKYIFISSGAVYGSTNEPADELSDVHPVNLYARCKLRLERLIQEGPLDYLILRLASPYGGFRMTNKRQGVIPILIEKSLENQKFEMLTDEKTIRDYFYITDFAKAIELLLEYEVTNEIINVGSGSGYTLKTIIEVVQRTTGEKIKVEKIPCSVNLVNSVCLDTTKLQQRTGFECEVTITAGVYKELVRIVNSKQR